MLSSLQFIHLYNLNDKLFTLYLLVMTLHCLTNLFILAMHNKLKQNICLQLLNMYLNVWKLYFIHSTTDTVWECARACFYFDISVIFSGVNLSGGLGRVCIFRLISTTWSAVRYHNLEYLHFGISYHTDIHNSSMFSALDRSYVTLVSSPAT